MPLALRARAGGAGDGLRCHAGLLSLVRVDGAGETQDPSDFPVCRSGASGFKGRRENSVL